MNARSWGGFLLVMLLAGGLLFHGLSYRLVEPDEGRYAEIGREMAVSGDWIVPRYNGEPYLDKPPLFYWLVAGSVRLFGAHEWSVRLVPSVATFLTILAAFFFSRRALGVRRALLGALALTFMGGVILTGRLLILDAVLTLVVVLALFTAYEATRGERLRKRWWILSACWCALGVLVKGPVSVALTVPPVFMYGWLNRQTGRPRPAGWLGYGAVVAGVVAPWFVAISIRCPEFPRYFFINQHLVRYLGQEHHPQPIWYYVPVLLGACLPWSLLLFPMGMFLFSRRPELRARRSRAMGFLLLCSGWCLAFFSFSRGKLAPYILPALTPLALLLGCYVEVLFLDPALAHRMKRVHRLVPRHTASVLALTWLALVFWSLQRGMSPPGRFGLQFAEAIGCLGLFLALLVHGSKISKGPAWALCGVLALGMLLELTCGFLPAWSGRRSPFFRAAEIEPLLRGQRLGIAFWPEFGSIPFLLSRTGDCLYVQKQTPEQVREFLSNHSRSLFIADSNTPAEKARFYLPHDMDIERYFDSGKTRFFVLTSKSSEVACAPF